MKWLVLLIPVLLIGCTDGLQRAHEHIGLVIKNATIVGAKLDEIDSMLDDDHEARKSLEDAIESNDIVIDSAQIIGKSLSNVQNKPDTLSKLTRLAGYIFGGIVLVMLIAAYIWFRRSIAGTAISLSRAAVDVIPRGLSGIARRAIERSRS